MVGQAGDGVEVQCGGDPDRAHLQSTGMIMSVLSLPHVNYSSASPPQAPQTVPGWNVTNETNVGASESALPAWTPLGPLALTLVSCSWRSFYWSQVFIPTNGISPKIVNKL